MRFVFPKRPYRQPKCHIYAVLLKSQYRKAIQNSGYITQVVKRFQKKPHRGDIVVVPDKTIYIFVLKTGIKFP